MALRPVVLVSRDAINQHSTVVLVCPLVDAASVSKMYPSDVAVAAPEAGLTTDSVVLTGQLRAVARTQLVRHLGELSTEVMQQVDKALRITLDLE
jgi:mRNA interferase MazF